MKIAFITTVNHNVGDDFVREGLKYLLKKYFGSQKISFQNIHKHAPITSRYGFEWLRNNHLAAPADKILPLKITRDRILEADIVIQSGAPVYWYHEQSNCVEHNEWYKPLIKRRFSKNQKGILLNLAAGSCQKYHADGSEFPKDGPVADYIKEFYEISTLTTVRDELSKVILSTYGLEAPAIPCSSVFAVDEYGIKPQEGEYLVMNYMPGGAHYTFGQPVDFNKWENEFRKCYFELKKNERIILACHNKKELKAVKKIDPDAEIFYSLDFKDYLNFYARAKAGIMNRVHGAFILASLGKPAIIIGNDTRALMGEMIGIKSYFVNEASSELLIDNYKNNIAEKDKFEDSITTLKEETLLRYTEQFKKLPLSN